MLCHRTVTGSASPPDGPHRDTSPEGGTVSAALAPDAPAEAEEALASVPLPDSGGDEARPSPSEGDWPAFLGSLPLARVDGDGVVTAANPALGALLGRPAGDLVGETVAPGGIERGRSRANDGGTLDLADPSGIEVGLRRSDGETLPFHARSLALPAPPGETVLCLVEIAPVFGRFRARTVELLQQVLDGEVAEQRRNLLRHVGHDLRAPLAAMRLELDVLRRRGGPGVPPSAFDRFEQGLERLRNLVDNLVDAGAGDAEVAGPRTEESVADLVAIARGAVAGDAEDRGLRLTGWTDPSLWSERLLTDRISLLRVLRLLLDNAIRFTARGEVSLRAEPVFGEGWIAFEVADTGPGIPPESRRRVFEELYQVANEARRPGTGQGLGLAIAARLARGLGGEIRLESEIGVGSRFTLLVPRTSAEGWRSAPGEGARALRGLRIQIADDDAMTRLALADLLREDGCGVDEAEDGVQALAAVRGNPPDVLILDLMMPGMDGAEVLRLAREEGLLERTAVVVVSGDTRPERTAQLRALGGPERLVRPVSYDEVRAAVIRALIRLGRGRRG
ncbi:ATP-binding protein [Myxococcota bacterium]|nr:ATP-binding protein [Myxococcota bacterium]